MHKGLCKAFNKTAISDAAVPPSDSAVAQYLVDQP